MFDEQKMPDLPSDITMDASCAPVDAGTLIEEVLSKLGQELGRRRRLRKRLRAISLLYFVAVITLSLTDPAGRRPVGHVFIYMFQFALIGGVFLAGKYLFNTRIAARAVRLNDVRLVGPLLEISRSPSDHHFGFDDESKQEARKALLQSLPQLGTNDAGLLDDNQRKLLRARLSWKTEEKELVIVINAVAAIRDVDARPVLEKFAAEAERFPRNEHVLEAASNAIPVLLAAQEEKFARETLLRPSSSPGEPSRELLRPAANGEDAEATLLLRSVTDTADGRERGL